MNSKDKLDLDSLRVIEAIAEQGSFSAAAMALHRVPSTISYTVAKLESSFGVDFFERQKQGVTLTEAGKELLRHSRHLLQVADDAQRSIERIASGWEAELRIAMSDLLDPEALMPLLDELLTLSPNMQITIRIEVLNGAWDSLASSRADILIGADALIPPTLGAISTCDLGDIDFLFAVAANHPLAQCEEPLSHDDIKPYRVVAVADTSHTIPHRSIGLLEGQAVFTVPNHAMKLSAQVLGLGVGTVAKCLAKPYLEDGRLVAKTTELASDRKYPLICAWKKNHKGLGLRWLVEKLQDKSVKQQLLGVKP